MKRVLSCLLILSLACVFAFPQDQTRSVKTLPERDPFLIDTGSSFSASVPRAASTQAAVPTDLRARGLARDFAEALAIISRNYVEREKTDAATLTKSAIDSMLHTLDPHSNYFDPSEFGELLTDQQSEYFGIGATIANYRHDGIFDTYVVATFPDSPAFRAGLRFGDRIVAVNGANATGKDSSAVRDEVRGRKGTVVRLTVERAADGRTEVVEIRRNRVPQPSIPDAYMIRPGVGYVQLSEGFNYTTSEEMTTALAELKRQGMTSLLLDLRGNSGGILDQAVKVAETFLPAGSTIVSQRGRLPIESRVWKSANLEPESAPVVVLVDNATASASEIVAGALQDHDRAMIVGENTFGKGLVQSVLNLPFQAGLTLTTARYYTPSGRSIQRDYSTVDIYDYYNHRTPAIPAERFRAEARTVTGRLVYGGNGIMPDEAVRGNGTFTAIQNSLLDPLFYFSAELAAGHVAGLANYRIAAQSDGRRIAAADFPVTESVYAMFRGFVAKRYEWNALVPHLESEKEFIRTRIRHHLVTAAYGTVTANQVLIENDRQVAKAVALIPLADQLARTARRLPSRAAR